MSATTTQPLKPFKAQYTVVFAARGIGCAGRQQRDLLGAMADLGFYLSPGSTIGLGEMNPMEVVPGSMLDQELCAPAFSGEPK